MPYADPEKQREYQRKWALRKQRGRKREAIAMKGGKCERCGEDDPENLEFHHRDPEEKSFGIVSGYSQPKERWEDEVDKCDLLCVYCHVEVDESRKRLAREIAGRA